MIFFDANLKVAMAHKRPINLLHCLQEVVKDPAAF
jgi:hypothetical protein